MGFLILGALQNLALGKPEEYSEGKVLTSSVTVRKDSIYKEKRNLHLTKGREHEGRDLQRQIRK